MNFSRSVVLILAAIWQLQAAAAFAELKDCNGVWTNKECDKPFETALDEKQPGDAKAPSGIKLIRHDECEVGDMIFQPGEKWNESGKQCECVEYETGERSSLCRTVPKTSK